MWIRAKIGTIDSGKAYRKSDHSYPLIKNTRTNKPSLRGHIWPTGQFFISV